jgi:hypothetical protein
MRASGRRVPPGSRPVRPSSDTASSKEADLTSDSGFGGLLDARPSLYDQIVAAAAEHPDGPLPRGGRGVVRSGGIEEPRGEAPAGGVADLAPEERDSPAIQALIEFFDTPTQNRAALVALCRALRGPGPCGPAAVRATTVGRPPETVRPLARWLVRHAADGRLAAVGLWLLAEVGEPEDRAAVTVFGLLDDMNGAAAVAVLSRIGPDPDRSIMELARRLRNWGLVAAVNALRATTDPEVKRWMVRELCSWGMVYFCDIMAETGGLLEALRENQFDEPDEQLIDNTARILRELCNPGVQTRNIAWYPDARPALVLHRQRLATLPPSLPRLSDLVPVIRSVRDGRAAQLDWAPGERGTLLAGYAAMLAEPGWAAAVRAGMHSTDYGPQQWAYMFGDATGVPVTREILARLPAADSISGLVTDHGFRPWTLLGKCPDDLLPEVVETLGALLATRPQRVDQQRQSALYLALVGVLGRLARHPGVGQELVAYAAASDDEQLQQHARTIRDAWSTVERE